MREIWNRNDRIEKKGVGDRKKNVIVFEIVIFILNKTGIRIRKLQQSRHFLTNCSHATKCGWVCLDNIHCSKQWLKLSRSQDRDIMCLVVFETVIVQWEMIENGRSIDVNFTVLNCNTSRLNCCTGFTKMGDTLAD
jgi:hypothetical protein